MYVLFIVRQSCVNHKLNSLRIIRIITNHDLVLFVHVHVGVSKLEISFLLKESNYRQQSRG